MSNDARQFAEEVMTAASQARNRAPNILPGVGGGGGFNAGGSDVTPELDKMIAEFVGLYGNPTVGKSEVTAQAEKIEGLLMMEATLAFLSQQRVDELVGKLHTLVDARV